MTSLPTAPPKWDRHAILAEVRRRDMTLAKLARRHGIAQTTLQQVFDRPFPKGEKIIADFIGVSVEELWPERVAHRRRRAAA